MTQVFTNKKGRIRLYDAAATPYYLEIAFDAGDFDGPLGIPLTEEKLILDRGNVATGVHYVEGSDETIMAPLPISFSGMLLDDTSTTYLKDLLDAVNDGSSTVSGNSITTDKATTQRVSGIANPAFADTKKKTLAVEVVWTANEMDFGMRYSEVFFARNEQKIKESADGVVVSLSGQCYGTISDIAAFTSGTSLAEDRPV